VRRLLGAPVSEPVRSAAARRPTHNLAWILLEQSGEGGAGLRAIVADDVTWTVADLRERTADMATAFAALGIRAGDIVRRDRLKQPGRNPDDVSLRACIGDAAQKFQEDSDRAFKIGAASALRPEASDVRAKAVSRKVTRSLGELPLRATDSQLADKQQHGNGI